MVIILEWGSVVTKYLEMLLKNLILYKREKKQTDTHKKMIIVLSHHFKYCEVAY